MKRLLTLGLLLVSAPASAQHFEASAIVGHASHTSIDRTAPGVQGLAIDAGTSWGGQAAWFLSTHWGVEGLITRQSTAVSMETRSGTAELFDMQISHALASLVYQRRGPRLTPFVFGGLGLSMFTARDFDTDDSLAWTVGAGLKFMVQRHVGLRAQTRYMPTLAHAESASTCAPLAFCQDVLRQVDIGGGVTFSY